MSNKEMLYKSIQFSEKTQQIWDNHIGPWYNEKKAAVILAFEDEKTMNVKELQAIKLQLNVLTSLKNDLMSHIETGKLAKAELDASEDARSK